MANEIEPPKVPESHVAFAKAVADIAVKHGMDRFEMTFRPEWTMDSQSNDHRINGNMRIIFSSVDGRGRPCRNLSISLEASLQLVIESDRESSN